MEKTTKNKGITLVSLIVTIIVLLSLVGVSIAMLTGENGIIERAKTAKQETENAQNEENTILDDYENKINQYINSSRLDNEEFISKDIEDFTPSIIENNAVYVTLKMPEVNSTTKIVGYIMLLNGKAIECISTSTYSYKKLNTNTLYNFQVIAIDEKAKLKYSEVIEATTTSRLYLYNKGNEYSTITGGWGTRTTEVDRTTNAKNGRVTKNADNIYLYNSANGNSGSCCYTINNINLSEFSKIYVKYKKTYANGSLNIIAIVYGNSPIYSPNKTIGDYTESFAINGANNELAVYNWDAYDYIYEIYAE